MNMYEKMATCKHHIYGYLKDYCEHEDEWYDFDDPDNASYLWQECKHCKNYERHLDDKYI